MRAFTGSLVGLLGVICVAGCSSTTGKMPNLAWWKKNPPADTITANPLNSTAPAGPQLPSVGGVPPVTTPAMPDGSQVATATYPNQPAAAVSPYPTTSTPTAFAPITPPGAAVAQGPDASPFPNQSATATTMPASTSSAVAPQTAPYNPAYGNAVAETSSDSSNRYPTSGYPTAGGAPAASTASADAAPTTRYGDASSGAPVASYGSTLPDSPSSGDDRYAERSESASTAPADEPYAPASENRYGAPSGDRYADSRFTAGRDASGVAAGTVATSPSTNNAAESTPTPRRDPFYRPGNTSDYRPVAGAGANSTQQFASPSSGSVRPAGYDAAPTNNSAPTNPTMSDRYGTAPASRY